MRHDDTAAERHRVPDADDDGDAGTDRLHHDEQLPLPRRSLQRLHQGRGPKYVLIVSACRVHVPTHFKCAAIPFFFQ